MSSPANWVDATQQQGLYVYWYRSPTGDTYAIILFPMFKKDKAIQFQHKPSNFLPRRQ